MMALDEISYRVVAMSNLAKPRTRTRLAPDLIVASSLDRRKFKNGRAKLFGCERVIRGKTDTAFDIVSFLAKAGMGKQVDRVCEGESIFVQGDAADSVFYIQSGKIKLTVVSKTGKEAVLALLSSGEFVGEACISGHPVRLSKATAVTDCVLLRISKKDMLRVLHEQHDLSDIFVAFLLERNARIQADLVDQLFNCSEKRLARILLLLAHFGKEGKPVAVIPKLTQETLAEMVGTTRSRVSLFMNRFRNMGLVDYDASGIHVRSSLVSVVLHD